RYSCARARRLRSEPAGRGACAHQGRRSVGPAARTVRRSSALARSVALAPLPQLADAPQGLARPLVRDRGAPPPRPTARLPHPTRRALRGERSAIGREVAPQLRDHFLDDLPVGWGRVAPASPRLSADETGNVACVAAQVILPVPLRVVARRIALCDPCLAELRNLGRLNHLAAHRIDALRGAGPGVLRGSGGRRPLALPPAGGRCRL